MIQLGPYILRVADNRDRQDIWNLINVILSSYGLTMDAKTIDNDLTDIEENYWNRKGAFFVLIDGNKVIGTVALHYESERVCELGRMYLDASYRGKGLGHGMLKHAMSTAKACGFTDIFLKTASVLTEAISLYSRAGFIPVPGKEIDGNCDVLMCKKIT
jgi:N-acetylglutamate synthase-like GNAT family acetyltransferase